MPPLKPSLHEYLDIHHFLKDLYTYRKKTEKDFSYEVWSQELDIRHRSYLRQIVMGRRGLSDEMIHHLAQRLNLSSRDAEYFTVLAKYSKSHSSEQRNAYGKRLNQLLRTVELIPIKDPDQFVISPLLPRLHTLLSFDDSPKTKDEILKCFPGDESKIMSALETLIAINLVTMTPQGYATNHPSFTVPENLGSSALINYHRLALHDAMDSLDKDVSSRKFESLILALTPQEQNNLLEDWQAFMRQVFLKYNAESVRGRSLFQVNFNIHTVSSEIRKQDEGVATAQ